MSTGGQSPESRVLVGLSGVAGLLVAVAFFLGVNYAAKTGTIPFDPNAAPPACSGHCSQPRTPVVPPVVTCPYCRRPFAVQPNGTGQVGDLEVKKP